MLYRLLRSFLLFIALYSTVNCTSVKRFNAQLEQPIPVEKLQKDINFTQRKLERLYPNLYGYISKEKLNYKFDSIRSVVTKPMTSKAFYFVISPVIASVRQGHMTMSPVSKRVTKKQAKVYKKRGDGPLSQFVFEWQNDKLYVLKSKLKKNKVAAGSEVVSINDATPQSVYDKYRKSITSDGYNTTFLKTFFSKRFHLYLTNEIGINDSLTYVFKQNDSLITRIVSRNKPLLKAKSTVSKDTVKSVAKAPIDKTKKKIEKKKKRLYGYDATNKEYVKSLKIISNDTLSLAILKIKNFSQGNYHRVYEAFFDSIKKANVNTLVIDVRNNPGGRIAEVVQLFSYLTDSPYTLLQPATVTSKTSLWKSGIYQKLPMWSYPLLSVGYPVYMGFTFFRTTKNPDGSFQYKLTGSRRRNPSDLNFKGKIYLLQNGGSFSASCLLASSLKSNPNVTFVGEETGGAFNGTVAGVMPVVRLPHSKIPLRLGLMDIKTINQSSIVGRGIFPDKEINPTIQDKIQEIDPEMEWIIHDVSRLKKAK
jgi:hypothetical protein